MDDMEDTTLIKPHSENDNDNDNDTLLKAQFDLFKFLVHHARTSAEARIAADPTLLTLQVQHVLQRLAELSNLIDKVERHRYHGTDEEERKLQRSLTALVNGFAGDAEINERIQAVITVERAVGNGGGRSS